MTITTLEEAAVQLEEARQLRDTLLESLADLETAAMLAAEDRGWKLLGVNDDDFSKEGLGKIRKLCRLMALANPLIKQGLAIRGGFVFGQGVSIDVKDDPSTKVDVNAVVQEFLDRKDVQAVWSGEMARDQLEHALGTDGEYYIVLNTDDVEERVDLIIMEADEVDEVIRDPDNRTRIWYFKRVHTPMILDLQTGSYRAAATPVTVYYPHVSYDPPDKPQKIGDAEVRWDQPVVQVIGKKIGLSGVRGVPDAYAAVPWASASKEYLENWSVLMKSLARFAWKSTAGAGRDRAKKVAEAHMKQAQQAAIQGASAVPAPGTLPVPGGPRQVGGVAVVSPEGNLEAIPKSGATIDAGSGLPLQAMAAAGLGVPVTLLNGNPGDTGARAVAETMTGPMLAQFSLRRALHAQEIRDVLDYVIDKNIEWGVLPEDVDAKGREIDVHFPEWEDAGLSVLDRMKAVQAADQLEKLPPEEIVRLALQALKVRNIDEIMDKVTDAKGNYVPPDDGSAARDAAQDQGNAGGYEPSSAPPPAADQQQPPQIAPAAAGGGQ